MKIKVGRMHLRATAVVMGAASLWGCEAGAPSSEGLVDTTMFGAAPAGSNAVPSGYHLFPIAPAGMFPAERRRVEVGMTNTGASSPANDWTTDYSLYREAPAIWSWVHDPFTNPVVTPGNTEVFNFIVTAPAAGTQTFSARMRKLSGANQGPFGTPFAVSVNVNAIHTPQWGCSPDTLHPNWNLPTRVTAGEPRSITLVMRNTGFGTWGSQGPGASVNLFSNDVPAQFWGPDCTDTELASYPVLPGASVQLNCVLQVPTSPLGPQPFRRTMYDRRNPSIGGDVTIGVGQFQLGNNACLNASIEITLCGNGTVDVGEECDDGDMIPGDGCDELCVIEPAIVDLAGTPAVQVQTFVGAQSAKQLSAVAVGDFNNDGAGDLVIGDISNVPAPAAIGTFRNQAGQLYVYSGATLVAQPDPTTVPGTTLARVLGRDPGDRLGQMSAGVIFVGHLGIGNLRPEIVVSAPGGDGPVNSTNEAGEVVVINGSAVSGMVDLLNPSAITAIIYGPAANAQLHVLAGGVNLIGDSNPDLVLGTNNGTGRVYVVEGGPRLVSASPVDLSLGLPAPATLEVHMFSYSGAATGRIGGVAAVGDLSGDGLPDLLFSNSSFSGPGGSESGAAYAAFGPFASGTTDVSAIHAAPSSSQVLWLGQAGANGKYGSSLAIGDVRGSATGEAVIGSFQWRKPDTLQYGAVDVFDGPLDGGATFDLSSAPSPAELGARVLGTDRYDNCGVTVATGDMNGDGRADVVIGCSGGDGFASFLDRAGEVFLMQGGPAFAGTIDLAAPSPEPMMIVYGRAGRGTMAHHHGSLALGDLDGDGRLDLAVGSFLGGAPFSSTFPGEVNVVISPW